MQQANGHEQTMQSAVILGKDNMVLQETEIPALSEGEALIKVSYCGICGSDIHILHGQHPTARFPVTPGHEFVGTLEKICGPCNSGLKPGDLVVAQPFFSCGNCEPCSKGEDNVCRNLRFMGAHANGAFAQYVRVLTRKTYAVPKNVSPRLAALTEPVAVAVHDVRRSGLQVGQNVLIIGGGPIGLLIAIVARSAGAEDILISEISESRRQLAQSMGFATVNPLDADFREKSIGRTGGLGFDVVFEVSGSRSGIASATDLAKITGTFVVVGMTSAPMPVDLSAVFAKELKIQGVRIHSQYSFIGAIKLLAQESLAVDFERLITAEYPLSQVNEAFETAQDSEHQMKVLVKMEP